MDWIKIIMVLLPVMEQAIKAVMSSTGKTQAQAVTEIVNHLTPGQPNSEALK